MLSVALISANDDHQSEIEEGKKLVESRVSCDKLNDKQLEAIGEYLMEQMHPGKSHEDMHGIMGSIGMMPMMQGIMGNWGYGFSYWNFVNILYAILLIGLIILVYLWIVKLWNNIKKENKKRK